jgi:hypothetical protein
LTELCLSVEKEYLAAARISRTQPKMRSGKYFLPREVVIICWVYSSGGVTNAYSPLSKLKWF